MHYQALQVLKTYVKTRESFEIIEVDLDGTISYHLNQLLLFRMIHAFLHKFLTLVTLDNASL